VRAAVCRAYGPPDVVRLEQLPPPELRDGQVRVRVDVAAVNFPDVLLVADRYQVSVPTPFVPGSEFAGVVVEVGRGAPAVAVGDRVTGTGLVGAFAEQAVTAAVRPVPSTVDQQAAAAFGVAHRTAYHLLRLVARLRAGEELVVLGAGGGVGLAAVQLGALLGASVTAVASSAAKLAAARAGGATRLVDHRAGDLRAALRECLPGGADVVLDPVGGDLAEPALRSLRRGGRFVTVGYASGVVPRIPLNLVLLKGIAVVGFQLREVAAQFPAEFERGERELLDLLAAGRVRPHIGSVYPLERAADALSEVAAGAAIGKVLIDVSGAPPPGAAARAGSDRGAGPGAE
jgi:NADPH:quinone reductase